MAANNEGWWGGYGLPPREELEAVSLRSGERWPQMELLDEYEQTAQQLRELAARTRAAAGDDTRAAQWAEAWRRASEQGVALWRRTRWLAHRIRWAD
jgi:hypothetical protein